jgi:hypothetical protein
VQELRRCRSCTTPVQELHTNHLKNHARLRRAVVGGNVNSIALRAPDGALATEGILATRFEELRGLWMAKPQGVNVVAALQAYSRICKDHGAEIYAEQGVNICDHLLAQAHIWVTKIHDVQMLPKLERWLEDYAWRNGPPDKRPARGASKASYIEIATRRAAGRA